MDRQYHTLLDTYTCPSALIATSNTRAGLRRHGPSASLQDNVWFINTEDPSKRFGTERIIDFNVVVDRFGSRLSASEREHDLMTTKIYCIELLRGQYLRHISGAAVRNRIHILHWIIRWRLGIGVRRFQQITKPLFDNYCERLRGGTAGLVPIQERLDAFLDQVRSGGRQWPAYISYGASRLHFEAVADEIGVPVSVFSQPGPIRDKLLNAVAASDEALLAGVNLRNAWKVRKHGVDSRKRRSDEQSLVSHVHACLTVWNDLYQLSAQGLLEADHLAINPFHEVSQRKLARAYGLLKDTRTGTPEPGVLLALLDGAARWVLEYGPYIIDLCFNAASMQSGGVAQIGVSQRREYMRRVEALIREYRILADTGALKIAPTWRRPSNSDKSDTRLTLDDTLSMLVTACAILIGAFGARRVGEILSLQSGCIGRDEKGNCWLTTYIEKTIQDVDRVPVPRATEVAVRLLERMSASGRERTGSNWLLQIDSPGRQGQKRRGIYFEFLRDINRFAKLIPSLRTSGWRFAPHQLRRAFAIYYYYGYRHADLDALSRFLRHFDPETTRRYVTEVAPGSLLRLREEIAAVQTLAQDARLATQVVSVTDGVKFRRDQFEAVRQDAIVDHLFSIYSGSEHPIGSGGAELCRIVDHLIESARASVRLKGGYNSYGPEKEFLLDLFRREARERYIEPHPSRYGHCGCRPNHENDLRAAHCIAQKHKSERNFTSTVPDFSYASDIACVQCPHYIGFSADQTVLNERLRALATATRIGATAELRDAAKSKLDALKAAVERARDVVPTRRDIRR